mmetsp:Transcript_41278/g.67910  ORF Transcript_41278/g.67910 Transcript_41278/m.67910 type:complete len:201 (+) Transcript_41278:733-1335(+)
MRTYNIGRQSVQRFLDLQTRRHILNRALFLVDGVDCLIDLGQHLFQLVVFTVLIGCDFLQLLQQQQIARTTLNRQNQMIRERFLFFALLLQELLHFLVLVVFGVDIEHFLILFRVVGVHFRKTFVAQFIEHSDQTRARTILVVEELLIFAVIVVGVGRLNHMLQKLSMKLQQMRYIAGEHLFVFLVDEFLFNHRIHKLGQ